MNSGRIIVMGDFSGVQSGAGGKTIRRPVSIDTLDHLIRNISPEASIEVESPLNFRHELCFASLDDFHPDNICRNLPICQVLLSIRQGLSSPATESAALTELSALMGGSPNPPGPSAASTPSEEESDTSVIQRLLGSSDRKAVPNRASRQLDRIMQSALQDVSIEPRSTASKLGEQEVLAMLTESMRAALNIPGFKNLEANWLGVDWLLRRIEDDQIQVELIDVSWERLTEMCNETSSLENTELYRVLAAFDETTPDLIVGLYTIERKLSDLMVLTKLGAIAGSFGATFTTHGSFSLCGCNSLEAMATPNDWFLPEDDITEYWQALQAHAVVAYLSLLSPRFLLRYPYGANATPIEAFQFEELPIRPDNERFCWGNPALIYALCWVCGYSQVEDLPMPLFEDGSGQTQQPPTEVLLNDRAAEKAKAGGIMALRANRTTGNVVI